MTSINSFARTAALLGDTTRAAMLFALMDGRALTAGELARTAGVSAAAASAQLAQLVDAGVLTPARQGRHRYFRIASAEVAGMMESMMCLAAWSDPPRHVPAGPRDAALRRARICYDHLAGELGVMIARAMSANGHLHLAEDRATITDAGLHHLAECGLSIAAPDPAQDRRPLCRACLDWSERRYHLGGRLGRAILNHMLDDHWIVRGDVPRSVLVTRRGEIEIPRVFGVLIGS